MKLSIRQFPVLRRCLFSLVFSLAWYIPWNGRGVGWGEGDFRLLHMLWAFIWDTVYKLCPSSPCLPKLAMVCALSTFSCQGNARLWALVETFSPTTQGCALVTRFHVVQKIVSSHLPLVTRPWQRHHCNTSGLHGEPVSPHSGYIHLADRAPLDYRPSSLNSSYVGSLIAKEKTPTPENPR